MKFRVDQNLNTISKKWHYTTILVCLKDGVLEAFVINHWVKSEPQCHEEQSHNGRTIHNSYEWGTSWRWRNPTHESHTTIKVEIVK